LAAVEETAPQYSAFISYSHRDDKVARWLHTAIETYRVPKAIVGDEGDYGQVPRRLGPVFRDEEELAGAAELGPKLEAALKASKALIVICSKSAVASRWVDHEIRHFKTRYPDRPVFAVIADGVPDDAALECFPISLKYPVGADGELDRARPSEPLAPDLQKLDRTTVKLKLIAGLLGVGYNDLANRDLHRSRRRLAAFTSGGVALIAIFAILSVVAFTYARVAVVQRKRAEAAQKVAEANAEEAQRKAWLANVAATEVRRQTDLLSADAHCTCAKPKSR
jgi:hypothetical protein